MLNQKTKQSLEQFIRATNYLSVAQIFLQDNFLLKRPLISADIKPRLLGHFGTCPGINIIYAHLSLLIKQQNIDNSLFVLGSGHGFPALQANLFLEETLSQADSQADLTESGIGYLAQQFSWPYGYASHANPQVPGVISEGGELGYALATAYGSVIGKPDLTTFCLIGDGEAETGTLAAAWQLNKLFSTEHNGVVLPILHLNGYKISTPTIFGRMSDKELVDYFSGLRYQPLIVDYDKVGDDGLNQALTEAYTKIESIRHKQSVDRRLPMIVFRSAKGLGGVKMLDGQKIEGNCLSHQVVLTKAKTDSAQLAELENWLRSYHFEQLFDGQFKDFVQDILPIYKRRMGMNKLVTNGAEDFKLPDIAKISLKQQKSLSMYAAGQYLAKMFELNPDFRLFSPDETTSNRLQAVFSQTRRAWDMNVKDFDAYLASDGKVIEMLNEQVLQGVYQGYNLIGGVGAMTSYEAFMTVALSMVDQYAKFIKQAQATDFRKPVAPMVYLLTSTGWRQDHNGFSHQSPSFISGLLRQQKNSSVYFPLDQNMMLACLDKVYRTNNSINAIVAGKQEQLLWRNLEQAKSDLKAGASVLESFDASQPDVVLAAAGDYVANEAIKAAQILSQELPEVKIRFVYINSLSTNAIGPDNNKLSPADFDKLFTKDKPIIVNYHGFPQDMQAIMFNYADKSRVSIAGYIEQGSTTSPFDMMIRNKTSRWHLVMAAVDKLAEQGTLTTDKARAIKSVYNNKIKQNIDQIKQTSLDLDEV